MDDDDDEGYLNQVIVTPWGPMTVKDYRVKMEEHDQTVEANTRQVESLFETLSKDDLMAVNIMLVNIESLPKLVHYFLGMSKLALRIRFDDEEIMKVALQGGSDDGPVDESAN